MANYIERLKAIPIIDILQNIYGIEISQKGNRYYCKIRDERTSSCAVYPNNTFYDFGGGIGGDTICLIETLDNCDRKTAMQKLSNLYHIEREYTKRDKTNLMDYEWRKLGIEPDLVSKNLNINIIEHNGQWSRNADINLNPTNSEQIEMFHQRYHISVNEFRQKDPTAYHKFIKTKVYHPLLNEKDDYFSHLNSLYNFCCGITSKECAFTMVATDPDTFDMAKEIEAKFTLLKNTIDDKSAIKVPDIKLNPQTDLASILNGTAKFKVSKISYFELFNYAQKLHQNLSSITVSYDSYIQIHTPKQSELRGIPHYSMYQNGNCKMYCMAKDYDKILTLFQGDVITSKQFSRPYAQENQVKKQSKTDINFKK
ncbi:MAG: hypothetical protein K2H13_08970 [Eubacterium sp.]|nr:hypothetical protein [Eubacterium sp.]